MDRESLIKRLCQLTLQDYHGYQARETPDIINTLRDSLRSRIAELEKEIPTLDAEYREMVADKNSDSTRRMEIGNRKLAISQEVDDLKRTVQNDEALIIISRREYSKSSELQASLTEQRQITDLLWGHLTNK